MTLWLCISAHLAEALQIGISMWRTSVAVLCCVMLCCAVLCYAVPYRTAMCPALPCPAVVSCCAVLTSCMCGETGFMQTQR